MYAATSSEKGMRPISMRAGDRRVRVGGMRWSVAASFVVEGGKGAWIWGGRLEWAGSREGSSDV